MNTLVLCSVFCLVLTSMKLKEVEGFTKFGKASPSPSMASMSSSEEEINAARTFCQKAHDIEDKEFEAMVAIKAAAAAARNSSESESSEEMTIDKKFKCFSHCILDQMHVLDEYDKLNVEAIQMREDLDDASTEAITECKAEYDLMDEPCEYGFKILLCIVDAFLKRRQEEEEGENYEE